MQYDVFISYSHAADDLLSERVQDGLQRFAKPWWRRRELSVFRDRTGLTADPGLWSSIVEAMEASTYFLLLASPEAAASAWVGREVAHWRELHGADHLLILLTDGELVWDDATTDFDWTRSVALPAALAGCFAEEPRHIDMRWARSEEQLDLTNGRFRDEIAELSAPVHGVRKDDIAGEHVRQHRRTIRTIWAAAITLAVLSAASVVGAVFAVKSAAQARRSEQRAVSQQHRADSEAQLATARGAQVKRSNAQLASANTSLNDTNQQLKSKNGALISQTDLTKQQRAQALKNAARANKNAVQAKHNADRATAAARLAILNAQQAARNADEAARNAETARQNADEAARQRDRAILNEETANTQRDLANQATKRANHERDAATTAEAAAKASEAAAKAADAADLSRQLAAESSVEIDNLDRALLLGVASREVSPTPAAHGSLMRLAESSVGVEGFLRPAGVTPDSPDVGAVAVATSIDGARRAEWIDSANAQNRRIVVWEGAHARSARLLTAIDPGPTFSVSGMSFSSDGGHLAAWDSAHGLIRSWDLSDPSTSLEHSFACDPNVTCRPLVAPDGQLLIPGPDAVSFLDPVTLQGPTELGRLGADGQGPTGTCAIPASSGVRPLTPFGNVESCLSPGGRYAMGRTAGGEPVLWDRSNAAAPVVLQSGLLPLQHLVVSDDDAVAAAVTTTGEIHVFDTASGLETMAFAAPFPPRTLAISPDRSSLAMIDASGNVSIRPLAAGGQLLDTTVHPANPARLEYSPDGRWLAITDGTRVQAILTVGLDAGRIGADLAATGFAFDRSGVGHLLAALPDGRTLLVWDLETNTAATAATAPNGFSLPVIVSPDGQTVAALSGGDKVMLFSLENLTQLPRTLPASRFTRALEFGPGGRLVGVEANGTLVEWDLSITKIGQLVASSHLGCTGCSGQLLAVSADGKTLAFADETPISEGTVLLRHVGGTDTVLQYNPIKADRLAFTPGGHYVVLHDANGTTVLPVDGSPPTGTADDLIAFSADDKTAASIDPTTNRVRLWSLPDLTLRATIKLGSLPAKLQHVALDKTGAHLAALDALGHVELFDVATRREIRHWSIHSASLAKSTLIMSEDGRKLAVGAANAPVWVFDAQRATPLGNVSANESAIAFSPDGRLLATAGPGVQIWATTSPLEPIGDPIPGDLPADPSVPSTTLGFDFFTPNVLQFSLDGKSVLELQAGQDPQTFDLRSVVVDARSLAASACSLAARDLTVAERQRFDPGNRLPHPICAQ